MKDYIKILTIPFIIALLLAVVYAGGYYSGRKAERNLNERNATAETVRRTVYDTAFIDTPIARDSVVVRYARAKLPAIQTDHEASLNMAISTPSAGDTVEVELPITQKEYGDSTYRAWVSGFMASLDSIEIYNKTEYITTTILKEKRRKWGFCLGPSVGGGWNGKEFGPFVGVTLTWGFNF